MFTDPSIDNLKDLVDKYEHPELFSFLDDYQLQLDFHKHQNKNEYSKNDIINYKIQDEEETGIVLYRDGNNLHVDFYGIEKVIKTDDKALSLSDTRTLPLEWAIRGKWGDFTRFKLKSMANHLFLAHTFDKMQSLSNSRTQILAHQIESTYRVVSCINPRFLIADEVGLGKTIEAGLIIKEFMIRHGYGRVLIVVPASLQLQWQQEMRDKFNEDFSVIDNRLFHSLKGQFPKRTIISLDFAKQDRIRKKLTSINWDIIVFDEAHRLRRDSRIVTKAYHLADEICNKTKVFLLLSATPFSGKLEELYFLIKLLNPNLLGTFHNFTMDYVVEKKASLKDRISSVVIRRRKIDVGGFTRRLAKTITFEFTPEERMLYDRTTEYIRTEYNKALSQKNRFHAFILIVYQKMLDSSSVTLHHTITKRIHSLEKCIEDKEYLRKAVMGNKDISYLVDEAGDNEELAESIVQRHIINAESDIRSELMMLREISLLAQGITANKKAVKLIEIIKKILKDNPDEKIIIFTQFFRTLEYLKDILKEYSLSIFHGGLSKEEKDRMVNDFKEKNTLFISTEAGGEGRNLQFARFLINYDLPWSPLKIEQRIGRIHRFGQKHDVRIFNFSTKDTIGEKVLNILGQKIGVFEDSFGGSDTLLGYVEEEVDFNRTIMSFHVDPEKTEQELDKKISIAKENFMYLEELTAHRVVDFNLDAFYESTQKERSVNNHHIKEMVLGFISMNPDSYSIKSNTAMDSFVIADKRIDTKYEGVFDSGIALKHANMDFFAFGHSLVDTIVSCTREVSFSGLTGQIVLSISEGINIEEGLLFNFIVEVRGARLYQTLIPVFVDYDDSIGFVDEEVITSEFLKFNFVQGHVDDVKAYDRKRIEGMFNKALLFLEFKIKSMLDNISKDFEIQIDKEIPAINRHYDRIVKELEDLLALQKSKEKIYNVSTLKGLITRTENKIHQFKQQKKNEMERIRNVKELRTSYKLLNCALVSIKKKGL